MGNRRAKKKLTDMIDPLYLQQLQDRIATAVGFSLILVDPEGQFVTTSSNPLGFCRVMQDQEDGRERCDQVNRELGRRAAETQRPAKAICPHTGLTTAAVPIIIDDTFLGIWMMGQVNLLDPGKGVRLNHDDAVVPRELHELLESVPTLWESGLDFTLDLMATTTSEFVMLFAEKASATERQEQLRQVSERTESAMAALRAFMNTADVILYVTDYETGEVLICNDVCAGTHGLTVDEMVGRVCYQMLGYDTFCPFCPRKSLIDENGELQPSHTRENYLPRWDVWMQCTHRASYWPDGRMVQVATCINITQRKALEEEVSKLAFEDKLLGIPNSTRMEQDIRTKGPFECLLVLDVEGLRKINDVYGRACGDELLMAVRDYVRELNIPDSILYRMNVADFGLLLRPGLDPALPGRVAERIFQRCKKSWALSYDKSLPDLYVTVNVCVVPVRGKDADERVQALYSAVEHTMEVARRTGSVAQYDDVVEQSARTRLKLELSLKNAVWEGMKGFYLVYQPIIDPGIAIWRGMEVLCRWNSPELGPVPPLEFIPVAESSGLIRAIGFWVLETAIRQVKAWGLDTLDQFLMEVNLSPVQLAIPNLAQSVVELLEKYGYPPEKLCLEVTESNELNFSRHNMQAIEQLHDIGVVIALDDFGTGYSSFNSLHKLPVEILKTDRSFINGMEGDPFLQRLFHVMVELAHGSGMKIVAEGVETDFQAEFLYQQGADFFQGYLYSKPLPAEEMEKELHRFRAVSAELAAMGYAKLDIASLGDPANYTFSPRLNSLLSRCMQELFWNNDETAAIDLAISRIGKGLGVGRAYVCLRQMDGAYSITHEWVAPDVATEKQDLQNIEIEWDASLWLESLRRDGLIVAPDTGGMGAELAEMASRMGIRALVEFPIWNEGELYGFVGVSEGSRTRNWTKEEVQLLHTIAGIIARTLFKQHLQREVEHQAEVTKSILEHMDTVVYVSDLGTGRILFASAHLQKAFGKALVGDTCWEALHERRERCEFCPVPHLLRQPNETYEWEYYNTTLGRHFRVKDTLIPWGGREAHLEYAEDITEIKLYQSKLEHYATTDTLTAALNRTSFNSAVQDMLQAANAMNAPVSIVFIDIDDLKRENDRFGHYAGDNLINSVVRSLRSSIRDSDLLGRYGGDEFVLAMMRCNRANAQQRMQDAQSRLAAVSRRNNSQYNFSYGIVENVEIPYQRSPEYLVQLVEMADRRMFDYKRKNKNTCDT